MFFYPDSLFFSVHDRSIIFYVQVEQEAVKEAVEFQDRTGVLLLLFIMLNSIACMFINSILHAYTA